MKALAFLLLAVPGFAADTEPPKEQFVSAPYWLKTYSTSFIKEYWTLTVEVPSFDTDLPKVLNAFSLERATAAQPMENLAASGSEKSQQLRYQMTMKTGQAVLKKLAKIGKVEGPATQPAPDRPETAELKAKIEKLIAAKKAHAAELGHMPDVSALVDEVLEHLLLVEDVQQQTSGELMVNMTVRQAAMGAKKSR